MNSPIWLTQCFWQDFVCTKCCDSHPDVCQAASSITQLSVGINIKVNNLILQNLTPCSLVDVLPPCSRLKGKPRKQAEGRSTLLDVLHSLALPFDPKDEGSTYQNTACPSHSQLPEPQISQSRPRSPTWCLLWTSNDPLHSLKINEDRMKRCTLTSFAVPALHKILLWDSNTNDGKKKR
jgi:hypothetical protein